VTDTSQKTTYEQNLERGMYPTANVQQRAALCLSCHVGNADKFATHRIMGAGHPRLSFELDTFLALMPGHHQIDKDYAQRKPTYSRTAVWAYGQLESARVQAQMVQQHFSRDGATFPELALFSCHSCHESSMHKLDWMRGLTTTGNPPGSVPLNDGHLRMAILVARQLDPGAYTLEKGAAFEVTQNRNMSGLDLGQLYELNGRVKLRNFSSILLAADVAPSRFDDREVGDGTALERGRYFGGRLELASDPRGRVYATLANQTQIIGAGTYATSAQGSVVVHALRQLDIELLPQLTWSAGEYRYARQVNDPMACPAPPMCPVTPENYWFGKLTANSVSATFRASYTFTPHSSLSVATS